MNSLYTRLSIISSIGFLVGFLLSQHLHSSVDRREARSMSLQFMHVSATAMATTAAADTGSIKSNYPAPQSLRLSITLLLQYSWHRRREWVRPVFLSSVWRSSELGLSKNTKDFMPLAGILACCSERQASFHSRLRQSPGPRLLTRSATTEQHQHRLCTTYATKVTSAYGLSFLSPRVRAHWVVLENLPRG